MEEKMNFDAATAFGKRKAREPYGEPPAGTERDWQPVSDMQILRQQLNRTRTGLGVVFSVFLPGLGLVFAQEYGAGIGYLVVYGALLGLGVVFTPWLWAAAALLWLVNIIHTATLLESEA